MSHLQKNLAALAVHFPALAAQIQAVPIPPGFSPATGTDGTPTYSSIHLSSDGKKSLRWLGHTSMPSASAAPIIHALDAHSNGQNGLGLSVGTGFEWVAFIQKLPRAQLLYVYESDLTNLRMALEICDLASLLETRRLILLTGSADAAARQLSEFLSSTIGFEPPAVLHPLPTLTSERRNQFLSAGEAIVRRTIIERQTLLAKLHEKIVAAAQRHPPAAPSAGAIAFLLTPRFPLERPIQGEIPRLSEPPVYVDRYDTASLALRFELLASHGLRGPVQIVSDLFRSQLLHLPADAAVETWIPPLIGPGFWARLPAPETFAPADKIIIHHAHHAELLKARGIPERQIEMRLLHTPKQQDLSVPDRALKRIALIADLPNTDAAALEIHLPTHLAVFAAARDMIIADYLTVHPSMAPDILRRALARAGVDSKIEDPALKDPMLRIIRDVLIPALPLLTLATNLAKEALPLLLVGDWPTLQLSVPSSAQILRFDAAAKDARWEDVALVHFEPRGIVPPTLLDAVANGATLLHAAHPTDRLAGSLPHYVMAEKDFPPPHTFIPLLKQLLRDPRHPQHRGLQLKG